MIIKVCGMRDPGNISQVTAIQGIDLIGLIFYAPSPRYVGTTETASRITSQINKKIVGVFVNETAEEVFRKCAEYRLDYIQLHGRETPEYIRLLSERIPETVKFIKAFPIRTPEDLKLASAYEGLCEYFLFDTPSAGYGGSGTMFDWSILQQYTGSTPFLLSGGIGPESLESIRNFHHPRLAGLDLNSRFEIQPGTKNVTLLSEFIQKIKSASL